MSQQFPNSKLNPGTDDATSHRKRLYPIEIDALLFAFSIFLGGMVIYVGSSGKFINLSLFFLAIAALALFLFSATRLIGLNLGCAIALSVVVCSLPLLLLGLCSQMKF